MAEFDDVLRTQTAHRPSTLTVGRAALQVLRGKDAGARLLFEERARLGAGKLPDLGSKNGTWVGGVCVIEALLSPGDSFQLNDTTVQITPIEDSVTMPLHAADDFYGLVKQSPAIRTLTARLTHLTDNNTTMLVQ